MIVLSKSELAILDEYYLKDPNWRRDTVKAASKHLDLPYNKVYKWGYDK